MKVAVFGAGAIGGYLAWRLAGTMHEVCVVARGPHLTAIREHGLRLETGGAPAAARRIAASDDPVRLGLQDIVVVAVKQTSHAQILDGLKALSGPRTIFVFVANGVPCWMAPELPFLDPEKRLTSLAPPEARVGCVVKGSA